MKGMGIEMVDFITMKSLPTGKGLAGYIAQQGIASTQQLSRMMKSMDNIIKNGTGNPDISRSQAINDMLINRLGLKGKDAKAASGMLEKYFMSISSGFDIGGMLKAMKKGTPEQFLDIAGKRRMTQLLKLVQGLAKIQSQTIANINDSLGSASTMAAKQMLGPDGAIARLIAALDNLSESFWKSGIGDAVLKFMHGLRNMVNYIADLSAATKMVIAKWALFAAVIGPVLIYVGLVSQGLGALIGGFSLLARVVSGALPMFAAMGATLVRLPLKLAAAGFGALTSGVMSLFTVGRLLMLSPFIAVGVTAFYAISRAIDMTSVSLGKYSPMIKDWQQSLHGVLSVSYNMVSRYLMGDAKGAGEARTILTYELDKFLKSSKAIMAEIGKVVLPAIFGKDNAPKAALYLDKIVSNLTRAFDNAKAAVIGFGAGFAKAFHITGTAGKFFERLPKILTDASLGIVKFLANITGIDASTQSVRKFATALGGIIGEKTSKAISLAGDYMHNLRNAIEGTDATGKARMRFAAIAGALFLVSKHSKIVSGLLKGIGNIISKPFSAFGKLGGVSKMLGLAMAFLGRSLMALGRVFLSPKSMGIFAVTTAIIALADQWDKSGPIIMDGMKAGFDSLSKLDMSGAALGFGKAGREMMGVFSDAFMNTQMLSLVGASLAFNISGSVYKKLGKFASSGAMAGARWGAAFKIAAVAGIAALVVGGIIAVDAKHRAEVQALQDRTGMTKVEAETAIGAKNRAAVKSKLGEVGSRAAANMSKAYADAYASIKAGLKIMHDFFVKKGAKIAETFKGLGATIGAALRAPLMSVVDWFARKLNLIIGTINTTRVSLGFDPISKFKLSTDKSTPPRPVLPAHGRDSSGSVANTVASVFADPAAMAALKAAQGGPAKVDIKITVDKNGALNVTGTSISNGGAIATLDIGDSNMVPF